jgi:hypothetical protein
MTARKRRKFAKMACPIKGCDHMGGVPQTGTVPGVKRHVIAIHGATAYAKVKWDKYPLYPESAFTKGLKDGGKAKAKASTTV